LGGGGREGNGTEGERTVGGEGAEACSRCFLGGGIGVEGQGISEGISFLSFLRRRRVFSNSSTSFDDEANFSSSSSSSSSSLSPFLLLLLILRLFPLSLSSLANPNHSFQVSSSTEFFKSRSSITSTPVNLLVLWEDTFFNRRESWWDEGGLRVMEESEKEGILSDFYVLYDEKIAVAQVALNLLFEIRLFLI